MARRFGSDIWRLLQPIERVRRVPGLGGDPARAEAAESRSLSSSEQDPAARIDAARERLRATIDPPADDKA